MRQLFSAANVPLIATFRPCSSSDAERFDLLAAAIHAGATYVDIEMEAPYLKDLAAVAKGKQCKVILSHHWREHTPPKEELTDTVAAMQGYEPDYCKVVARAHAPTDNIRVLSLYEDTANLLAFCMGSVGRWSRIASYLLGAPFIYAAPDNGPATADGQPTIHELHELARIIRMNPAP